MYHAPSVSTFKTLTLAIVATLVATLGAVFAPTTSASAHPSTYCGHGETGNFHRTIYITSNGTAHNAVNHVHYYLHDMRLAPNHIQRRNC